MSADGSDKTFVGGLGGSAPAFSPDGKKIAFSRYEDNDGPCDPYGGL